MQKKKEERGHRQELNVQSNPSSASYRSFTRDACDGNIFIKTTLPLHNSLALPKKNYRTEVESQHTGANRFTLPVLGTHIIASF